MFLCGIIIQNICHNCYFAVKECQRVLKVLTSSKAPLVKKRQAMHQMFGDYRKKIESEEKVWEKGNIY